MVKTLYTRLAVGLFLLLLAVGLLYTFISLYSLREYNASVNQELHRDLAKNLVADRNLVSEGQLDRSALKELFALYMTINPSIEIYLLDLDGTILSYSADPAKIKRKQVSLDPIQRLMDDMSRYPVLGDDPRSHDRQKVFSVTPVPSADNPEGYLYVVLRGEEYDAADGSWWPIAGTERLGPAGEPGGGDDCGAGDIPAADPPADLADPSGGGFRAQRYEPSTRQHLA